MQVWKCQCVSVSVEVSVFKRFSGRTLRNAFGKINSTCKLCASAASLSVLHRHCTGCPLWSSRPREKVIDGTSSCRLKPKLCDRLPTRHVLGPSAHRLHALKHVESYFWWNTFAFTMYIDTHGLSLCKLC